MTIRSDFTGATKDADNIMAGWYGALGDRGRPICPPTAKKSVLGCFITEISWKSFTSYLSREYRDCVERCFQLDTRSE